MVKWLPYLSLLSHKDCTVLVNDKSVSRLHAHIEISFPKDHLTKPDKPPQPFLIDKSRFGTFLNAAKAQKDQKTELKDGDEIKFGVFPCLYRVSYVPMVLFWNPLAEGLSMEEQAQVLKWAHNIGMLKKLCVCDRERCMVSHKPWHSDREL